MVARWHEKGVGDGDHGNKVSATVSGKGSIPVPEIRWSSKTGVDVFGSEGRCGPGFYYPRSRCYHGLSEAIINCRYSELDPENETGG